ncbi:hypothetical protein [Ramlibacter sp.]|uniref:hypothetical protein n=1 Tax=Ramlibacter sp. TaxID=1917967 RepID=UPI002C7D2445|nr:hypothetical protein [Ramlibacter sp.]HWI82265.1 hypothetical protein [Ramlibacter sp.]
MDNQSLIIAVVVVLALAAVAVWLWSRREQSKRLEQRFGPEYRHAVERHGDVAKAEAELRDRERRVEKLNIVPLAPADAQHFADGWRTLQARFVDNPQGVVGEADQLVRELMLRRGYPMGDFDRRAADISVDHPHVVEHYRAAQAIALRDRRGEADTEALRQAVVHYRALFDELLQVSPLPAREAAGRESQKHMEVH